jgi:hypothetical protein
MAAMRTSAIIEQMKQGAKLHRELDRVELRLLDGGKFLVPAAWLDALLDEHRIVAESDGFFRLS